MKLIIARHGQTIGNKNKVIQGWADTNLNSLGKEQSKKLALKLKKEKIDIIYCSDLGRCKQTIAPYLKLKTVKIKYVKELRELNHGVYNGKNSSLWIKWIKSPDYIKWCKKNNSEKDWFKKDWWNYKNPKGESFKDLKERVSKFVNKIIKIDKGKTVLFVTHGGTKAILMLYLLKKRAKTHYKKYKVNNTGISVINIKDDGNHKARLINNTRHLKEEELT
jgi:alpha-ribazole phosphatase